jgi:hypothetical protein
MDSNHRYPAKFFWLPRRSPQFTFRNVNTGSLATTNPDDLAANGRATAIEFNWAPP